MTTSDTVTITAHNNSLSGGQEAVTYTVLNTDTLLSIAGGLAGAIYTDTHLQTLGVTASNNSTATLATTQNFKGQALLPTGASTAIAIAAFIPGVHGNPYQLNQPTGTSASLTYDVNGNMTSDGTNSYSWDAENRLLKITYPGSGNNSAFSYDGFGRNVSIVETVSGSVTSTKQFVWSGNNDAIPSYQPGEARNAGGTVTAQYFSSGESLSGTSYYFTKDQLGSIREMTNGAGTIESQVSFDPFGQATNISGSVACDFGFSGLYLHSPSSLGLAVYRQYNSAQGRWINRDPISELGGTNLYAYVHNEPVRHSDVLGLRCGFGWSPNPWYGPTWGNWGGMHRTNGNFNQGETEPFPGSGAPGAGPLTKPPCDPIDLCFYFHDVCLNIASRISKPGARCDLRKRCDQYVALCLVGAGVRGVQGGTPESGLAGLLGGPLFYGLTPNNNTGN